MKKKILITVPKLSTPGGVSAFWNALLPELLVFEELQIETLEIGGHGKNILGPLIDQRSFNTILGQGTDLVFLNPSLGFRSFFRDGLFARQLAKKGIAFVVFFHGWDLDFEGKVTKKYVSFFQRSFGKADTLFVLSKKFAEKLREWGYKGTIVVETTAVDVKLLKNFDIDQKYSGKNNADKTRILFLSRLLKEKGIYETIDAFVAIRAKFHKLELVIAGDGEAYEEIFKYSNGKDGIVMKGHVEGQQKIDLFKSCHIYCLPSYTEGLPTSVLEAMAFGLPVITTPVGGLVDFFKDEKMGCFVAVGNVTELQHRMENLVSDSVLAEEMGRFNYQYAHEMLMSTKVAKRLCGYMLDGINNKRKG
jgi:glycosyltransferase involved in cell wall biosynthesis